MVGGNSSFHPGKGYLFKSTDFGNTWTLLTSTAGFGNRIFINPKNSLEIYGTSLSNIGCTDPNGQCGIYKSTDGAQTWTELNIPESVVQNVAIDVTPGLLYAAAYDGLEDANVYTSADGGNTWKTDFPDSTALVPNFGMEVVRADPNAASTAYALGPTDTKHGFEDYRWRRHLDGGRSARTLPMRFADLHDSGPSFTIWWWLPQAQSRGIGARDRERGQRGRFSAGHRGQFVGHDPGDESGATD